MWLLSSNQAKYNFWACNNLNATCKRTFTYKWPVYTGRPTCCWSALVLPDMSNVQCVQVEYCFTSEGTDKRPQASSLRGLDAATYYRHNGVLNCGHAVVRRLILDSLHHWADEYQVDGFCFVNAETMVQGKTALLGECCAVSRPRPHCNAVTGEQPTSSQTAFIEFLAWNHLTSASCQCVHVRNGAWLVKGILSHKCLHPFVRPLLYTSTWSCLPSQRHSCVPSVGSCTDLLLLQVLVAARCKYLPAYKLEYRLKVSHSSAQIFVVCSMDASGSNM